jgi:hypothetical protein
MRKNNLAGRAAGSQSPVAVKNDTEQLAGGSDADALLIAQLVQPALHAEHALPILTVSGAAGHRSQKVTANIVSYMIMRLKFEAAALTE